MSFDRYRVDLPDNVFPLLRQSVGWEEFSKGRQIAVLHRPENKGTPLIRTTTVYQAPSQPFKPIHESIIQGIQNASGIKDLDLNNAMLEVYDSRYTTMGFHTDQALDIQSDSYICLFSCYENGADAHPRVLTVKNNESGQEFEVQLLHHSVVVFSAVTNRHHLHKIEGRDLPEGHDNRWMGFTLRLSKSFVRFRDGVPHHVSEGVDMGELTLATDMERRAFYGFKGQENKGIDYQYPELRYTISPSDLVPTVPSNAAPTDSLNWQNRHDSNKGL